MDLLDRHPDRLQPDCERLDLLARELSAVAGQLRTLAEGLRSSAAASSWHSPAARAFTGALGLALAAALRLAARLDATAGAAAAHARRSAVLAQDAVEAAHTAEQGIRSLADRLAPW